MMGLELAIAVALVGAQASFTGLAVLDVRHADRTLTDERGWLRAELGVEDADHLRRFHRVRTALSQLRSWVLLAVALAALLSGLFEGIVRALAGTGLDPTLQSGIFFAGAAVAYRTVDAAFRRFETRVVDARFDDVRRGSARSLRGTVTKTALLAVVVGVASTVAVVAVERAPGVWWVLAWALVVVGTLVLRVVYPRVVLPLLVDLEPVREGALYDAVADVFERAELRCSDVYRIPSDGDDAPLRAFVSGLGRTNRVVLSDALVEELSRPQLKGVLAHEVAHLDESHFWKGLSAIAAQSGVLLVALGYLVGAPWWTPSFEVAGAGVYPRVALGLLVGLPMVRLTAPIKNRLTTRYEHRADAFAAELLGDPTPLVDALRDVASENRENPFPHPAYAAFYESHPSIPDRIRHLRDRDAS